LDSVLAGSSPVSSTPAVIAESDQATSARYAYPALPKLPAAEFSNHPADDAFDRIVVGINAGTHSSTTSFASEAPRPATAT